MKKQVPEPAGSDELRRRITRFCAFRERCSTEVLQKLKDWSAGEPDKRRLMKELLEEGFVDDLRYARIFVRSKFNQNHWGRIKIRWELKSKMIPEITINEAMEEVGEAEYLRTIDTLVRKKKAEIKGEKNLNFRDKILNFVVGKGFETSLVLQSLNKLKIIHDDTGTVERPEDKA